MTSDGVGGTKTWLSGSRVSVIHLWLSGDARKLGQLKDVLLLEGANAERSGNTTVLFTSVSVLHTKPRLQRVSCQCSLRKCKAALSVQFRVTHRKTFPPSSVLYFCFAWCPNQHMPPVRHSQQGEWPCGQSGRAGSRPVLVCLAGLGRWLLSWGHLLCKPEVLRLSLQCIHLKKKRVGGRLGCKSLSLQHQDTETGGSWECQLT